jgi:hypothetical protein
MRGSCEDPYRVKLPNIMVITIVGYCFVFPVCSRHIVVGT